MGNDWITNFFDKCRIVSDEEMQSLWAKVLAGEANSPGTYSKRTVNLLGSLDKTDAELFTSLCGFVWAIGDAIPLIYDRQAMIYRGQGIDFSKLAHLDDIGLVKLDLHFGITRTSPTRISRVSYYGTPLIIDFGNEEKREVKTGQVMFTKAGKELAGICGSKAVDGFLDYIVEIWAKQGLILSSPYPRSRVAD